MTKFQCSSALFRPLDTLFIALHGQEEILGFALLPPETLDGVEAGIDAALGNAADPGMLRLVHGLQDVQKANLRVTQAWLRIVLWQLRLRLGHLTDDGTAATVPSSSTATHHHYRQNSFHSIMNHDDGIIIGANANANSCPHAEAHALGSTVTTGAGICGLTNANANSRTYRYP